MADAPSSLLRYRSQRRTQQQAQEPVADAPQAPPPGETVADEGVTRSKSRYHRKNATDAQAVTARQTTGQKSEQTQTNTQSTSPQRYHQHAIPYRATSKRDNDRYRSPASQLGSQQTSPPRDGYESEDYITEVRQPLDPRDGQSRSPRTVPVSSLLHTTSPLSLTEPNGELFPPPRPEPVRTPSQTIQADGPPTSDKIRATKSISELQKFANSEDGGDSGGGCFGLFKRKRGEGSLEIGEKTPVARPPTNNGPPVIKNGGQAGGVDAPVSAVNAGDRRVLVECGKSKSLFPVTPTTTPVDLIKSAANCMSERIEVRSAVLLEYFVTVGVQRPLRRYEHVRDVMNSWDTDKQNSLLLVDPGTGSSEAELSIAGVPHEKPAKASWLLQYSQKPGKWDKRLITLHTDGQITLQRDPNKPQQQENVCHLSDFDIYTPDQEKLRKKVKPPKKYCYAIKSQQKTSMFETMTTFVHFFCTNDKHTADEFYRGVQGWRSWYLVNVMGEGKKRKSPPNSANGNQDSANGNCHVKSHRPGESFDSHYQLGSFKPLVDVDQFDKRPNSAKAQNVAASHPTGGFSKSASQFDTTVSPERRTSAARRQQHPPGVMGNKPQLAEDEPLGNYGRRASVDQKRTSMDQTRPAQGEFAKTGLLGRTYSQRQREMADRDNSREQPFTAGPNLLNGGENSRTSVDIPRRNQSTRTRPAHKPATSDELRRNISTRDGGGGATKRGGSIDLQRSGSTRAAKEMPKPLVDLTPQYREPPQHAKKGRGHYPEQPGQQLIDSATSPEDPIGAPPSTDWRGRNTAPKLNTSSTAPAANSSRARSTSQAAGRPSTSSRSPSDGGAFADKRLLAGAHAAQGWGSADQGRGVMDGSRAKGPMLDVREQSQFAQGSLLDRVERERGREGPVIDRGKREEGVVKVGEGFG